MALERWRILSLEIKSVYNCQYTALIIELLHSYGRTTVLGGQR